MKARPPVSRLVGVFLISIGCITKCGYLTIGTTICFVLRALRWLEDTRYCAFWERNATLSQKEPCNHSVFCGKTTIPLSIRLYQQRYLFWITSVNVKVNYFKANSRFGGLNGESGILSPVHMLWTARHQDQNSWMQRNNFNFGGESKKLGKVRCKGAVLLKQLK